MGMPCSPGVESGLGTFATRDAPESRRDQDIRDDGAVLARVDELATR